MRVSLVVLALIARPAVAQDPLPNGGGELFRGVLHRLGYTPVAGAEPPPRVVVVFGEPSGFSEPAVYQRVLGGGGSVLIAADRFRQLSNSLPGRPAVALDGELVTTKPVRLEGSGQFVEVVRATASRHGLTVPELVATATPVRRLIRDDTTDPWVGTTLARYAGGEPFAVGGVGTPSRPGRVVVLAGESALSNQLLAGRLLDGPETRNLEFALNLARWLKPPGDGPTTCLFLDHGQVITVFDAVDYTAALMPLLTPTPPPLSALLTPEAQAKLADAANEAVDKVQTADRLNAALARGARFGKTVQWLLGVLALLATVALIRRARAARRPSDAVKPTAEPPRPAGAFAQRREELLGGGDHTADVREYLVELFRVYGLPLDEYRHPKRMPRVEADAATRRRVATLWEVAYGPAPVSYSRWKELEPMIETVQADAAAGRWRFAGGRA